MVTEFVHHHVVLLSSELVTAWQLTQPERMILQKERPKQEWHSGSHSWEWHIGVPVYSVSHNAANMWEATMPGAGMDTGIAQGLWLMLRRKWEDRAGGFSWCQCSESLLAQRRPKRVGNSFMVCFPKDSIQVGHLVSSSLHRSYSTTAMPAQASASLRTYAAPHTASLHSGSSLCCGFLPFHCRASPAALQSPISVPWEKVVRED